MFSFLSMHFIYLIEEYRSVRRCPNTQRNIVFRETLLMFTMNWKLTNEKRRQPFVKIDVIISNRNSPVELHRYISWFMKGGLLLNFLVKLLWNDSSLKGCAPGVKNYLLKKFQILIFGKPHYFFVYT